jgi:hypothetical protein
MTNKDWLEVQIARLQQTGQGIFKGSLLVMGLKTILIENDSDETVQKVREFIRNNTK